MGVKMKSVIYIVVAIGLMMAAIFAMMQSGLIYAPGSESEGRSDQTFDDALPVVKPRQRSANEKPGDPSELTQSADQTITRSRNAIIIANDTIQIPEAEAISILSPQEDVALVRDALLKAGFNVDTFVNENTKLISEALEATKLDASNVDDLLIYYTGIGFQMNGENLLSLSDSAVDIEDWSLIEPDKYLTVAELANTVKGARQQGLIFVDAGRFDPSEPETTRGLEQKGLARISEYSGVPIMYSSESGELAMDRPTDGKTEPPGSPFAIAVTRHMNKPGVELRRYFQWVRDDVRRMTLGEQTPEFTELAPSREFYFTPREADRALLKLPERYRLSKQKRIALVISAGDYNGDGDTDDGRGSDPVKLEGYAPDLPNTINDANDIVTELRAMEFDVTFVPNPNRVELRDALFAFETNKIKGAGTDAIVVIYYAGHAIQVSGVNYIVPAKSKLPKLDFKSMPEAQIEAMLGDYAVPINYLYDRLREPDDEGVNAIILDACRDNPWESRGLGRSVGGGASRGLADIPISMGRTVIAYATKPGDTAADGGGRNSPYTNVLKKHIAEDGLSIRDLFDRVAGEVQATTGKKQQPFMNTPHLGDVCFGACEAY